MIKLIRKYSLAILFVYLTILLTLGSTWSNHLISFSLGVQKFLAIAIYLPFVFVIGYKLFLDIKGTRDTLKEKTNLLYYLFAVYYVLITAYRFVTGAEVKENLYYSLVFFGCLAFYLLIRDKKIHLNGHILASNLLIIAIYLLIYRFFYVTVGEMFIEHQPVNINLTSGITAMLLPFLAVQMCRKDVSVREACVYGLTICGSVVVICTSGARAIFLLTIFNLVVLFVCGLKNSTQLKRFSCVILSSVAVVMVLAALNVGTTREVLYRETGIDFEHVFTASTDEPPVTSTEPSTTVTTEPIPEEPPVTSTEPSTTVTTEPIPEEPSINESQVDVQRDASDRMRSHLVGYGLEQVKINPWIGTGDVLYYYQITEEYGFMQSSHNFVIEGLICYGVIGLLLIAALFIMIILDTKVFTKGKNKQWQLKIAMLLVMLFYLALGFVQPTVFDCLVCLVFVSTIAAYRCFLNGTTETEGAA